jgi:O-antigen chain-terminating methyltransferase
MQRIIEEFIEKRKKAQAELKTKLNNLGLLLSSGLFGFFKRKKYEKILNEIGDGIDNLILSYNKEWDAYSNNHMTGVIQSLTTKIDKLEADYSNTKYLLNNFIEIESGLKEVLARIDNIKGKDSKKDMEIIENHAESLSLYQYSDFEQRFRGDEKRIREKLIRYYTYFESSDDILDIGCGRGEFVEILKANGKKSIGIDISDSMLKIAKEKGLKCINSDVLEYMKSLEKESVGGIFSSQVIEHFTPDYLREVVIQAQRIMKEGAVILLETINPLSLFALSRIFFLDVTHQKPLHPEYMRYLLESCGFFDVEVIYSENNLIDDRLETISPDNDIARVFNTNVDKINNILYASAEYTVKGIKK